MDRLTEMAGAIGALLKERGASVAVAESSAGGLISASLLSVPGASAYFLGGGVVYTRTARRALLDLPEEVITMNAGSEEYALIERGASCRGALDLGGQRIDVPEHGIGLCRRAGRG